MTDIVSDFRTEFARIMTRYQNECDIAGIKVSAVRSAQAHIDELETERALCTCGAGDAGFEVPTRRDRQCDAALLLRNQKRLAADFIPARSGHHEALGG